MEHLSREQKLGNAIKKLRNLHHLPSDWVAHKLGYADKSSYCKIERGVIKDVSVWKIIEICKLFDCNIVHLFLLAGIDVFDTKIKTWTEFNDSFSKNNEDSQNLILVLLINPPPPPIK